MAEIITSKEDANTISDAVADLSGWLRERGFEPAAIGACMASAGFALIQKNVGHERAKQVLATFGDILASDASLKS